jgi:hypothetical protein
MPSLRSCSVGPPPSAIHGRGRLTRHPCRVAHCAEPPLGLTRGRVPQKRPRRPTGRPVRGFRSSVRYLVGCQAAIASRLAPTVDPGMPARDWSAVGPPSLASQRLQKSKGRSAYTFALHHSSGRALARLQLLILIHPPPREAEWRCSSGGWARSAVRRSRTHREEVEAKPTGGDAPG